MASKQNEGKNEDKDGKKVIDVSKPIPYLNTSKKPKDAPVPAEQHKENAKKLKNRTEKALKKNY